MPLRALVDGSDLIAPLVADEDWVALRERVRAKSTAVELPCCDSGAFLRSSKLGTKHFVHRRAAGCAGSGETYQHLWAKAEVVHASIEAGWRAATEVAGDGWRADVLASRGETRVAFEVQWSPQDETEGLLRQQRYREAGIRGCWFFRGELPAPGRRELPMFALRADDEQVAVVELAGRTYPMRGFVMALLDGQVRFSARAIARLRVSFVDMDCWRCRKPGHVYYAQQLSLCGHEINYALTSEPRDTGIDPLEPELLALIRHWLAGDGRGTGVTLGAIKRRYSRTVERSYLSFGCPHCDALFGDWFVREAVLDAAIDDYACARFEVERPMIGPADVQGHWCLPADGRSYCTER
jgi:competence protein CoiA